MNKKVECKHKVENEIMIEGVLYDGCRKSVKNILNDVCDCTSEFCKSVQDK